MRIAFTGTSSTGKTTLACALLNTPLFAGYEFVTADARKLLDQMGHRSMDKMSRSALRDFQQRYLEAKLEVENGLDNYITDRSFVDVAAYWLARDAHDLLETERVHPVERCRRAVVRYDFHFYFPLGLIPFRPDGYRSEDRNLNNRVDQAIRHLLLEWKIPHTVMGEQHLDARIRTVERVVRLKRHE